MTVVIALALLLAALYFFRDVAWIEEPGAGVRTLSEADGSVPELPDPAPGQAAAWSLGLAAEPVRP